MTNHYSSRRTFLQIAGISTIALTFPGLTSPQRKKGKAKIAVQLYTVRKAIERDFSGTMKKIADMGFVGIETYFLPESITLQNAAKVFKDVGLKVIGMHADLPVGEKRDVVLRMAEAYNSDLVIYPGWPEEDKYKTVEATKHMVEVYNETAEFLRNKGLRFGLHNHWWEFEKRDGIFPFYYLLNNLDKEIFFEIDTYWAKTGGQDPAKVVRDFGKRAPLLHIKDGPAIKGDKAYEQVPAGEGSMDFPAIAKAGGENTQWMIVEFDEYDKDIFDGMKKSYAFLTTKGLAEGKEK
jgi:sugar phosphate isomerase/epimerase